MGNIVSGLCGSVHNYLSYSNRSVLNTNPTYTVLYNWLIELIYLLNSVFFYNIGGSGKIAQSIIALITLIIFFIGPTIINYVPRVIGAYSTISHLLYLHWSSHLPLSCVSNYSWSDHASSGLRLSQWFVDRLSTSSGQSGVFLNPFRGICRDGVWIRSW